MPPKGQIQGADCCLRHLRVVLILVLVAQILL